MHRLLAVAAISLLLAPSVGCVGQHHQLRYTPALQIANGDPDGSVSPLLTPGEPVDSVLGVVDVLLGPGATDLPVEPFVVDEGRLEELFPVPTAGDDVRLAYRFVHFTDVQIRDRGNGVGAKLERLVDRHIVYTQNNFYQDHADLLYFAHMAGAMRQLLDRGDHAFVVHTGDAMHMSNRSELAAYNRVLERVLMRDPVDGLACVSCWADHGWLTPAFRVGGEETPSHRYFNVVGNHDVLRWGNWTRGDDRLVRANEADIASSAELSAALVALGSGGGNLVDPALPLQPDASAGAPPRGYYAVDLPLTGAEGLNVRLIALNVYEASPRGRFGTRADEAAVGHGQAEWLRGLLEDTEADPTIDHVIVLGHERLWYVAVEDERGRVGHRGRIGRLLSAYPKVVAYLSGHAHNGASPMNSHVVALRYPFAHYTLPSMMEFPKVFSSILVERLTDGRTRITAHPVNLADLGGVPDPFGEANSSVDLRARVHTRQQEAFERWLLALDAICGDDVSCRAHQLASECLGAAVIDRPDRVIRWRSAGGGFFVPIVVPRENGIVTSPHERRVRSSRSNGEEDADGQTDRETGSR